MRSGKERVDLLGHVFLVFAVDVPGFPVTEAVFVHLLVHDGQLPTKLGEQDTLTAQLVLRHHP